MTDTRADEPLTLSQALGEIVFLMMQTPAHRHFAVADLEWLLIPPLLRQQFRLFRGPEGPVGAVLWARLNEEAEERIEGPRPRLRPDDWTSGDRVWIVEVIAPSATPENQLVAQILTELSQTVLVGETLYLHNIDAATGQRERRVLTPQMLQGEG